MERIWIYQSNRELSDDEGKTLMNRMDEFTGQWKAHGKQLAAKALLKYNRFLVIGINESVAQATGCSIDKSVHLIKEVQQELSIDFFDRMQVAYRSENGIQAVSRQEFEKLLSNNQVDDNTIVFNNTVNTTDGFKNHWEVPMKNSWHHQFFKKQSL